MSVATPVLAPAPETTRAPRVVQSVLHAAGLLKLLHTAGRPLSLSDLARRIDLSKPATHALLQTLQLDGLVERDDAGRYRLSWGLYELGSAVIRSTDLARMARDHIDRLAEKTGDAVLLGILHRGTVLYLDRDKVTQSFSMVASTGRRSPLHTNATGKVLLAFQKRCYIDALLHDPLAPTTTTTITDPARLSAELAHVRRAGYALCLQEQEVGLSSIAVPVFGRSGVQAGLTIAGPSSRLNRQALPELLLALRTAAGRISRRLSTMEAGVDSH